MKHINTRKFNKYMRFITLITFNIFSIIFFFPIPEIGFIKNNFPFEVKRPNIEDEFLPVTRLKFMEFKGKSK